MVGSQVTVSGFRELEVYKRAYTLALDIHKTTFDFPKHEQFALTSQIRRSSKSICAQIAEGYGKSYKSKPEFQRFISIAIGSADETSVWLDFAADLGYINKETKQDFLERNTIICKQLHKLSQSLQS